jgi:hypothetical protein
LPSLKATLRIGLLAALLAVPAAAHNGLLAIGYPLAQITIDGELSDWPTNLPRYPLTNLAAAVAVHDTTDFHGSFRVGYNLG